jgi:hypothetical protein
MNPWVLIAIGVAFVASNASSFFYGQHVEAAEQAQAQQKLVTDKLAEAAVNAEADKQAAIKAAKAEGIAAGRAAALRGKGNEAIRNEPLAAACDWRPQSFSVLVAAVRDANGATPADTGLSDAVRRANGTVQPSR